MSVLKATHLGSWYPQEPQLKKALDSSFSRASAFQSPNQTVKAIISPHAGYSYCLDTAAHSFKSVNPALFSRAIILGPSHSLRIDCCTICDCQYVQFPSKKAPIDLEVVKELVKKPQFKLLEESKANYEHSLEMMFPLLEYIFREKELKVVPIMVGSIEPKKAEEVAEALRPFIDEKTLLVISSDFCHWGERFNYTYLPEGGGNIWQLIEKLDREAMEAIKTKDVQKVRDYFQKTHNTICGRNPIMIAMIILKGQFEVQWLHYSQSSQITSKKDSSVSYSSGVFLV